MKHNKIPHETRTNIIYSKEILDMNLFVVSEENDVNYNTVRNIVKMYNRYGRTNKKIYKTNQLCLGESS